MADGRRVTAVAHPWTSWPELQTRWAELAAESPFTTFFLTPEWMTSWLKVFGTQLEPRFVSFLDATTGVTVGACLLVPRTERRGPFSIRRIYLNAAGEDAADETMAEHNAFLCLAGWEREVAAALRGHLGRGAWDEFVASAMAEGPCLEALSSEAFPDIPTVGARVQSPYVDFAVLERSPDGYLAAISRNTREQIRRSRRNYTKEGPLQVQVPADVPEALGMLDELAELHQATWTARGEPGVFASRRFVAFHRDLIERVFPKGGVQILRVRAGSFVIGLLYNLVRGGTVHFYQSGLRFSDDNRVKPGLVAHAAAIQYCRDAGLREYDFLGGGNRYKQSLSTGARTLTSLVFRRPSVKMRAITLLRGLNRRMRRGSS